MPLATSDPPRFNSAGDFHGKTTTTRRSDNTAA